MQNEGSGNPSGGLGTGTGCLDQGSEANLPAWRGARTVAESGDVALGSAVDFAAGDALGGRVCDVPRQVRHGCKMRTL